MTSDEILDRTATENGITVADLTAKKAGKYAERWLTLVRMQAARRLRGRHFSLKEIGKKLARDHSVVIYYLNGGGKNRDK